MTAPVTSVCTKRRNANHIERVGESPEHQHSPKSVEHAADTARQSDSAQNYRRERLKLLSRCCIRLRRTHPRGENDCADASGDSAETVDQRPGQTDIDAAIQCCRLARSDRDYVAAKDRVLEQYVAGNQSQDGDYRRPRNPEHGAKPNRVDVAIRQVINRQPAGGRQRQPARDRKRAERNDKRRSSKP